MISFVKITILPLYLKKASLKYGHIKNDHTLKGKTQYFSKLIVKMEDNFTLLL